MKQAFHLVMKERENLLRVPLKEGEKYTSKQHMGVHEARQFLEKGLEDFAIMTIHDPNVAQSVLEHGWDQFGIHWNWVGGYARDQKVIFILGKQAITSADFYQKLGLKIEVNSLPDAFKVGKYLNRLFAHHDSMVQGKVLQNEDDVLWVKLDNGHGLKVRYATRYEHKLAGMLLVSQRGARKLGVRRAKPGDGLRVTIVTPKGLAKGHAMVMPKLNFDIVIYDNKPLVRGDRFTFGLMGEIHPGDLFTDVQSLINFRLQRFAYDWALTFLKTVMEAIKDEDKIRGMLQFYTSPFHVDPESGKPIWKDSDWSLMRAMRAGIKFTQHPSLLNKVFRLFSQQIMDCDYRVRIPVPEAVGVRRYAFPDPSVFDMDGEPSQPGVLKAGQMALQDHNGPIVVHRQPNAHRGEKAVGVSVNMFNNKTFVFLNMHDAAAWLEAMGGGDFDDPLVCYKDTKVVDHFKTLEPYPLLQVEKPEELKHDQNNPFAAALHKMRFDREMMQYLILRQRQNRTSIGQAVNPIMLDTLITDEKATIESQLANMPSDDKVIGALEFFDKFPGNMLRGVASRLEEIIDSVKKDGADVSEIEQQIRAFWKALPVVPRFCLRGGFKDEGRLPASRRGDNLPVIVNTSIDKELDRINHLRQQLEDTVIRVGWQQIPAVAMEINTFPFKPGAEMLGTSISTYFRGEIDKITDHGKREATKENIIEADRRAFGMFKDHPLVLEGMLALYKNRYDRRLPDAPIDEKTKRPRKFPDGVLWGSMLSGLTIKALEMAGLTSHFEPVYLSDKAYRKDYVPFAKCEDGVVMVNNDPVGFVNPELRGMFSMDRGMIQVPVPSYPSEAKVAVVVDGWASREHTPQQLQAWLNHIDARVDLVPKTFVNEHNVNTPVEEHAVEVMLDGQHFGWVSKADNANIILPTSGRLLKGNTFRTLRVAY